MTYISSFFGVLALLLASIGLYGVISYSVTRRTTELGIRKALGARTTDIIGLVLRESMGLVAIGVAIAVPSALVATRWVSSQLYGLKPNDPWTIAAGILILASVSCLAGYLPARRAARVDPVVALHSE